MEQLRQAVFEMLEVIRVYTKAPGKKLERTAPYLLKRGSRLVDLAAQGGYLDGQGCQPKKHDPAFRICHPIRS